MNLPMKFIHTCDPNDTRQIHIVMEDETGYAVMASTETGQHTSGLRRKSATYKWVHKDILYRVQVQTTILQTDR